MYPSENPVLIFDDFVQCQAVMLCFVITSVEPIGKVYIPCLLHVLVVCGRHCCFFKMLTGLRSVGRHRPLKSQSARNAVPQRAFEIVEVEGSGLGAVACRDFLPGELVLSEKPLCTFDSSDSSLRMVERKCAEFTDDLKKKVLSLEDSLSFDTKSFRGILETNGIVCETGSETDPKALFLQVSRFNHSCNANCDYSWRQQQNRMDIYTQTIIRAGDELCIPYIDLREPRQVRQQLLKENWRFRCRCEVCCLRDFSDSDRRRLRLGELSALMYSSRTSGRTLRIAKKLLKLYKEESISAQQG